MSASVPFWLPQGPSGSSADRKTASGPVPVDQTWIWLFQAVVPDAELAPANQKASNRRFAT
jgi:hypothetical protein